MGRRSEKWNEIITVFVEQYPSAFSLIPYKVAPLTDDIAVEIFNNLGLVPREYKSKIYAALTWYKTRPSYLQAVAFGGYKHNLSGHKIEKVSFEDMCEARKLLIAKDKWTPRMAKLFKAKTGRLETSDH